MNILMVFFFTTTAFAQQQITVTGQVFDENRNSLPGATILVEGTTAGTTTDLNGMYSINVADDAVLIFSYVGYSTQQIPVLGRVSIDVRMSVAIGSMDELIVIGYGTQSRRMLTTSISSIGSEGIEGVPVASISTAMQGKLGGVRVFQSDGGQPGSDASIRIRGGSSITGSNEPLVIVDGIRRQLSDINPNDVASIQVLKDASSTAIYGSRASNGVILVTTKRGSEGVSTIRFDVNVGSSSPWRRMDLLNAEEYLTVARIATQNGPNARHLTNGRRPQGVGNDPNSPWSTRYLQDGEAIPAGYKSMQDPIDPSRTIIFQDNDFQDIAFRSAMEKNYYLSASGGTNNIRYSAGLGYSDTEGVSIGTNWYRFSGKGNVDFKIRDNLELRTNFNHTVSSTNTYPNQNHIFGRSIWMAPTAKVYMEDGSLAPGNNATFTSALFYNDVRSQITNVHRTQFNSSLIWDVKEIEGLRTTLSADYFITDSTFESFMKSNVYDSSRPTTFNFSQPRRVQLQGYTNYTPSYFGNDHNINLMVGGSYEATENFSSFSSAFGGATDQIRTLNAAPEKTDASTIRTDDRLLGAFSRLSYDYKHRYLLALSLRRDVSSRFSSENRVGYFPGASVGWIITEESFIPDTFVDMLKIRSSIGQTGNVVSGLYTAFGTYTVGRNYFNEAGAFSTGMPNFSLEWEKTTQWDVGLDISMFNERINLSADIYEKVTTGLLFSTPLPRETGYNSIQRNVGSVKYYGWDFELSANIIESTQIKWGVDFNISYSDNKVISLPDNGIPQNRIGGMYDPLTGQGVGGIAEGERLNAILGWRMAYIIDNWQQANNAHFDANATGYNPATGQSTLGQKFPGDVEWVDVNGDGRIDDFDKVVLGYTVPHTFGGISNNFNYKRFELNIFFDYAIGHSILDEVFRRGNALALAAAATPTREFVRNAWQNEGDYASGRANQPRISWHDAQQQSNIHRDSDLTTYRADYLSLREVRIAYNLPEKFLSRVGISTLTIYARGQNLYYFTKYPGFVPEFEGSNNHSHGSYPIPRKFLFGINVSL